MVLGIAEDFSSEVILDSELRDIPSSGMYLNSGVHPSITLDNLLQFLPSIDIYPDVWDVATNYTIFSTSRKRSDLVAYDSKIYQSIKAGVGQNPATETAYWLETNLESLRLKTFIYKVKDKVYSDLKLNKRLINNQYLYENGENTITLPNDYAAWVFEPKGSDYTSIRINQIALQKKSTTPVNLYIINQGVLIDTLTVTPKNGIIEFDRLDYVFTGKGKWMIAIDSTEVESNNYSINPLRYKGFVAYTANGIGATPESAEYSDSTTGNGLCFNISAYLDSTAYIENNLSEFGNYIRATFEYMVFQMFLSNSNNQSNLQQRVQMDKEMLIAETKNIKIDSVVKRYMDDKKEASKQLKRTFDTQIGFNDYEVTIGTL